MPQDVVRKALAAPPPNGDPLEFVMSDETVDRMGDVIVASGWQLENFRQNPIALFGHRGDFPIGNWRDVRVDGTRLIGRLELMPAVSERLQEIHTAAQAGVLRAVSVGFSSSSTDVEPIDGSKTGGVRYMKSELLECSLVAVPANPNALQIAKSLNISSATRSLIFGEPAVPDPIRRRMVNSPGETAANPSRTHRTTGMPTMTLSQRIEALQEDLNIKRDRLAELNSADISTPADLEAIEELTSQIDATERELTVRKAAEAKIGLAATAQSGVIGGMPAIISHRGFVKKKDISGLEVLVRAVTAQGIAMFGPGNKSVDRVLDDRYPGQESTAYIAKADQTIGTTTVAGWAAELVQETWAGFLEALVGASIYPILRDRGVSYSFDGNGTVNIPARTAGGAGGGFFAEGSPIRVGRITTTTLPMTSRSMGVIVPFSRKLAMQSTPAIESVVREAMVADTSAILDPLILDATAADTARPAGLLNGVAAAASGYGGGDYRAVQEDFKALLTPFISASAADNITVVMNSGQGLALALMDGPVGNPGWFDAIRQRVNIIESTHATANRLISLRNTDFATALGDGPQFEISDQAVVHMEDTTPLEIVSGTPTVADPVRSFWQTGVIGVRMIMDVSWLMRRSGMVSWVDGTSW